MFFWFKVGNDCSHSKVKEFSSNEIWYRRSETCDKLEAYQIPITLNTCAMCNHTNKVYSNKEYRLKELDVPHSDITRYKIFVKDRLL